MRAREVQRETREAAVVDVLRGRAYYALVNDGRRGVVGAAVRNREPRISRRHPTPPRGLCRRRTRVSSFLAVLHLKAYVFFFVANLRKHALAKPPSDLGDFLLLLRAKL